MMGKIVIKRKRQCIDDEKKRTE